MSHGKSTQASSKSRITQTGSKHLLRSELYGRAVEEVDPFVFEDTFCVIARKYGKHYVCRFSASRSLFMFGPLNPIRRFACRVITNQLFDAFIITVILCNCVTLALSTNYEVGTTGEVYENEELEKVVDNLEIVFLVAYSIELVLKVIAKGLFASKFSYLRNGWNVLDFVVVVSSYVTILLTAIFGSDGSTGVNLDFLRTLRVFRAIKTISILPGLRMLINALFGSVVQLIEVMALTMFCLMIFALLALQLFMGKLKQKCVLIKGGSAHLKMIADGERGPNEKDPISMYDPDRNRLYYEWINHENNWYMRPDGYPKDEFMPCNNETGRLCPIGYICLQNIGENFDDGWTSFDNFHSSMLSTFQLITLDFWERLYEVVLSTTSPAYIVYFLIVIFLGAFYLLNLMLAVVAMSYEEECQRGGEVELSKHQKLSMHRTASTFSFEDPKKLNVQLMMSYRKRTPSEREMIARTLRNASMDKDRYFNEDDLDEGEKKPNLHNAIMKILGRRISSEKSVKKQADEDSLGSKSESHQPSMREPSHEPTMAAEDESEDNETAKPSKYARLRAMSTVAMEKQISAFRRCTRPIKRRLSPVVNHWAFEFTITIMIVINTILLASEHHKQPQWLTKLLEYGNHVFLGVFLFEAVLKICALQEDYFRIAWNLFDLYIVLVSLIDVFSDSYGLSLTVIRSMRLMRVFKLAQSWITMKVLLNIIFSTFGALGNLILILMIVIYIFAVLGLQILGRYYTRKAFEAIDNEEDFPRWNWQSFWYAFMMVFRVLCGEWIELLWDCLKATKEEGAQHRCFLIYLPTLVVGNFIVLNLFLALLLNSFDTEELNAQRERELQASGKADNLKKVVGFLLTKKTTKTLQGKSHTGSSDSSGDYVEATPTFDEDRPPLPPGIVQFRRVTKKVIVNRRKEIAERMIEKASLKLKQAKASSRALTSKNSLATRRSEFGLSRSRQSTTQPVEVVRKIPDPCVPLKCWTTNCCCFNALRSISWRGWDGSRAIAMRIVTHPFFEWFILALIFASSITLCFEDIHLENRPNLKEALKWLSAVFTAIFVIEMLLKWYALGLWNYFTNSWTILDFIVVMISLISIHGDYMTSATNGKANKQLASLKALRTLRALRPLRAISRWQGMKIVVNALMYAIPSIVNVLLVCLLFWLVFSIMGVQFFKGKFYKCVDNDSGETLSHEIVLNKSQCCAHSDKWSWVNTQPNFDNVFQGYLTLFQVATFEGWIEAMRAGVDSVGGTGSSDWQPVRDNSFVYYSFFVIFIVFGSFFTLNLFIGVIIDNFNRLKKKYEGNLFEALLTPSQRNYYTAMKKLGRKKPRKVIKRPKNGFLAIFYDLSMSRRFEIAIFLMIFLNMVVMAFDHHKQRQIYADALSAFNSFFTTIYGLEAFMKIIGLRQYYFTVPWNLFDFVLVLASVVDLTLGDLHDVDIPFPPTMLRIIRVFRIGRVLRLIKAAKGIRKLLFALIVSLPALFNIGALLALITFIYAILGMSLFGNKAKNTAIDEMFCFDTFQQSCLMLFRVMTAAGWNDVLTAMTDESPECGTYRKIKCGRAGEKECASAAAAVAYFVSYLIITFLIVINMYIAVILENFVEANQEEEVGIVEDDLEMFYVHWSRYDPQATQFINFDQLSDFLSSLDPPLGLPKPNIVAIVAFNLPIARGNKIHCLDIIHSLVKHVLGHIDDSEEFRKLQEDMEHKFRKQFPTRKLLDIISSTRVWKVQHNAAIVIQRAWRAHRAKKFPGDRVKSMLTVLKQTQSNESHHSEHHHHGMLHRMGNLLHVGHHHDSTGGEHQRVRRLSLNVTSGSKINLQVPPAQH